MLGSLHRCGKPRIEMPQPIRADWGEEYAEALSGLPVLLVYIGVRPREDGTHRPIIAKAHRLFDPESFRENDLDGVENTVSGEGRREIGACEIIPLEQNRFARCLG
jgi:hypothetical protein